MPQSLKSRGIQFPGRDLESLAPIFTPPQSISRSGTEGSGAGMGAESGALAPTNPEDAKEIFDVSRNSVELLSTVLTSSPQQEALQVLTFVPCCEALYVPMHEGVGFFFCKLSLLPATS